MQMIRYSQSFSCTLRNNMLPPEVIEDQMPDPTRKRYARQDDDDEPPDKPLEMPKNIQVNGTAQISPRTQTSKFLSWKNS